MNPPIYCQFCGWEGGDTDTRVCPKRHEYKGLVREPDYSDLDAKIAAYKEANPDWETREP